ncbi:MAG: hypothetical protein JWM99_3780, partial [Verrucomicrobiales bacterium]|nr:hypothetical protein [Verrucomicrobiales bacterium]
GRASERASLKELLTKLRAKKSASACDDDFHVRRFEDEQLAGRAQDRNCFLSGVHHLSAVDVDGLAGDIAGVVGGQENGHSGEFRGGLPLAERGDFAYFFRGPGFVVLLLRRRKSSLARPPNGLVKVRFYHSWREGIDADPVRREVFRGALNEIDESGFRRAVGRVGLRADLARH